VSLTARAARAPGERVVGAPARPAGDGMTITEVHDLAKRIAREMGPPWRYDVRESRDRAGELTISAPLRTDLSAYGVQVREHWHDKGRLLISGSLPKQDKLGHQHWTYNAPSITVAASR